MPTPELSKDQETFLCRLADAFRNEIFETVPASSLREPGEGYMLVDMKRMMAGITSECISGALCISGLIRVHLAILRDDAIPEGYGRLAYQITPDGYQTAVNALARRAIAEGYTLYSADDAWEIYNVWS